MSKIGPISSTHIATLDPTMVVYAVGDIHGRLDLLEGVTGEIARAVAAGGPDGARLAVLFLGDYIDRGPDSSGVISHLIALREQGICETLFLRGNHEQFLLDLIDGHAEATTWLDYGGLETLRSYGAAWPPPSGPASVERLEQVIRGALPHEHLRFLRETKLYVEHGDYLFVHAGMRPDRLLNEQSDSDMLWFRAYSDEAPVHGKTVVHGHTPQTRPASSRWRIGIDTKAFASGVLTAVRIDGAQLQFLKIESGAHGVEPSVTEWEAIDRPRDPAAAAPRAAGARRRTGLVGRGKVSLVVASAVAAVVLAGLAAGLAWRASGHLGGPATTHSTSQSPVG